MTVRRQSCISGGRTKTQGRIFLIPLPTVGSRLISQMPAFYQDSEAFRFIFNLRPN